MLMCFNLAAHVPNLTSPDEIQAVLTSQSNSIKDAIEISKSVHNIPIKRLLMILDMATHGGRELAYDEFMSCYESVEYSAI